MFKKLFKTEENVLGEKSEGFLKLLKEKEVNMEIDTSREGITSFYVDQQITNGPVIRVVAMFAENETRCHQYIFDYVSINAVQRTEVLELINSINENYMFTNFYLTEDNRVNQKNSIDIVRVYDPEDIFDQLLVMIQHAREQYGNFMKLLWK